MYMPMYLYFNQYNHCDPLSAHDRLLIKGHSLPHLSFTGYIYNPQSFGAIPAILIIAITLFIHWSYFFFLLPMIMIEIGNVGSEQMWVSLPILILLLCITVHWQSVDFILGCGALLCKCGMAANSCISLAQPPTHPSYCTALHDNELQCKACIVEGNGSFARHDLRSHPGLKTTA